MNDEQKRVKEILRAYNTKIVLHPGGWGTDLPALWNNKVIRQRIEMIDNGGWDKATDTEIAMYLSAASGIAPLDRDWTDIFVYEVSLLMGTQVYDMLNEQTRELNDYQKMEVDQLKHKIRNSQIKNEKSNKGGTMQKTKIVIDEREDGVLLGITRDGVDPFVKKMDLTLPQILDQMPFVKGVLGFAEAQWAVAPKNPAYVAPKVEKAEIKKVASVITKKKAKDVAKEQPVTQAALTETAVIPAEKSAVIDRAQEFADNFEKNHPIAELTNITELAEFFPDKGIAPTLADPGGTEPAELTPPKEPLIQEPKKTRVSADAFQYKTKDGKGPFTTVQEAMDALGLDKANRPTHNRYDRLSKKLQEEIIQEKKA
jgi:hypothetical protein